MNVTAIAVVAIYGLVLLVVGMAIGHRIGVNNK